MQQQRTTFLCKQACPPSKGFFSRPKRTLFILFFVCIILAFCIDYSTTPARPHFGKSSSILKFTNKSGFEVIRWSNSLETGENENNRIFFHETTGRNYLSLRQLCAIESAAKENQDRPIQLFMQSERIDEQSLIITVLRNYSNVVVYLLNTTEYFSGTPLEAWYSSPKWKKDSFRTEHFSDYLRVLSLYKAGGMYMDLDFVTLKRFDQDIFWNFVSEEKDEILTNSAIHLEKGHPILKVMLNDLAVSYLPNVWGHSGPSMIQRTVLRFCRKRKPKPLYPKNICQNLKVLPKQLLYPYPYDDWKRFFNEAYTSSSFENSTALHMWNKLSKNEPIIVGSNQTYSLVAREHCPLTYAHASDLF